MIKDKDLFRFQMYAEDFEQSKDPADAVKAIKIYNAGLIKATSISKGLAFYESSRLKNKCIKCGEYYERGEPCFVLNGKDGWHLLCATDEEKLSSSMYVNLKKKFPERYGSSNASANPIVAKVVRQSKTIPAAATAIAINVSEEERIAAMNSFYKDEI